MNSAKNRNEEITTIAASLFNALFVQQNVQNQVKTSTLSNFNQTQQIEPEYFPTLLYSCFGLISGYFLLVFVYCATLCPVCQFTIQLQQAHGFPLTDIDAETLKKLQPLVKILEKR